MSRKKVSAYAAKTHLGQLLRDAENGQSYVITRRGKPIARLEPAGEEERPDFKKILADFRELRKRIRGRIDVRALVREGRRH